MSNALYYGDNLAVLRESIQTESVDLVYLDPPFNSNANYNVLFRNPGGNSAGAQIEAFEDTWHWGESAEEAFDQVMHSRHMGAAEMLRAIRGSIGETDMMAYLAMMAIRLIELYRVLKPVGSLYLHCDPTASHYLKILLDGIFGADRFRNEIIWKRANAHNDPKRYGRISDTLLYYTKGEKYKWNPQHTPYREEYYESHYKRDGTGRWYRTVPLDAPRHGDGSPNLLYEWKGKSPARSRTWAIKRETMEQYERDGLLCYTRTGTPTLLQYADKMPGVPLQNIWTDIPPVNPQAQERLGYQTQKPISLLERIINASSSQGDVVLDPFCGCGTAVHAAQKLARNWIGIDVTHLAISLIERRLKDAFPAISFEVHGTPKDIESARDLAFRDKYQFQWWAVSLVNAQPFGGKKKGADGGIDGKVFFKPDNKRTEVAIVSVKGGENVNVAMVRDLRAVIEREKAPIGLFITLVPPTQPMLTEATKAGFYESLWGKHPRLQILTVEDLLSGKRPNMPLVDIAAAFKAAPREKKRASDQRAFAL